MKLYSAAGQIPSLTYRVFLVNTTDGSLASGCYVNGTQTAADFAIDDLLETDVCGDSAAIKLRISFSEPTVVTKYSIVSSSFGSKESDPKRWRLWGNADREVREEMNQTRAMLLSSVQEASFTERSWMCDPPFFAVLPASTTTCDGALLNRTTAYWLGCFDVGDAQAALHRRYIGEMRLPFCRQEAETLGARLFGMASFAQDHKDGLAACYVYGVLPDENETSASECEWHWSDGNRLGSPGAMAIYSLTPLTIVKLFDDIYLGVNTSGHLHVRPGEALSSEKWSMDRVDSIRGPQYHLVAAGREGSGLWLGTDGRSAKLFEEESSCNTWIAEEVKAKAPAPPPSSDPEFHEVEKQYRLKAFCRGSWVYLGIDPSFNVVVDDNETVQNASHWYHHDWALVTPKPN